MNEIGASEKDAHEYIKSLISTAWKKMNEEQAMNSLIYQAFIEIAMNLVRMGHCMYQHEDGFGVADHKTKNNVLSLLIQPISLARKSHGNSDK